MKNKILLVGGAGYIGGLTCDYLINQMDLLSQFMIIYYMKIDI